VCQDAASFIYRNTLLIYLCDVNLLFYNILFTIFAVDLVVSHRLGSVTVTEHILLLVILR